MRLAEIDGRACFRASDVAPFYDVHLASNGRFGLSLTSVYDSWDDFMAWATTWRPAPDTPAVAFTPGTAVTIGSPRQVFGIGLNYMDHVREVGQAVPAAPMVFTKFASSLTGPDANVAIGQRASIDWEVEMVAVISRPAWCVTAGDALRYVAGITVGQDLSDRARQLRDTPPQFAVGKSLPGFGPVGPEIVTLDEVGDISNLEIGCSVNGVVKQRSNTSQLIFSTEQLIVDLSQDVRLLPGDLIFTGTPPGVAAGNDDSAFLQPGDVVESWISGVGQIRTHITAD